MGERVQTVLGRRLQGVQDLDQGLGQLCGLGRTVVLLVHDHSY